MHDFDAERQGRSGEFRIGGEVFSYRLGIRPEVLAESEQVTEGTGTLEVLKVIDSTIMRFLSDEDNRSRWRELREREEDAVTFVDLTNLLNWLTQEQTGRPPTSPEPSSPGLSGNGTVSTDVSSPEQVAL